MSGGRSTEKVKTKMSRAALTRMIFSGVLIVVLAVCFTIFVSQEQESERLLRKHEELAAEKAELEAINSELEQLLSIGGTPEYIERVARDSLGMVAPEDIIIEEK
ncbi:MAG TPA: septum formation initiator family protein [Bacillota bacterium]|nr:septum formation initiator family protein [Bacillota bacterium]